MFNFLYWRINSSTKYYYRYKVYMFYYSKVRMFECFFLQGCEVYNIRNIDLPSISSRYDWIGWAEDVQLFIPNPSIEKFL